ncbi:MAG: hypothetical protein K0U98_21960 [Deltaproteobacteria bacterium]|nr:hypothetical protein [Deltaproteobacteria bacterium]
MTDSFSFEGLTGEVARAYCPSDLEGEVRRIIDPAAALETLHWGRNYLYRAQLQIDGKSLDVAVKQFRNQGGMNRLRRSLKGSKALRSWAAANAFVAAGIDTAEPVLLVESTALAGPSYFITRFLPDVTEARFLLRSISAGNESEDFPLVDVEKFFADLGGLLRRMHDRGLWHRDLSIGNVLFRSNLDGGLDLFIVDLNRSRQKKRLSVSERTRDLCRLSIDRPEHQELFLGSYWGGGLETSRFRTWLYQRYRRGFLSKIGTKKRIRGGARSLLEPFKIRRAHAHIPLAEPDASARDKVVWDHLSDQPHQHASRIEKAMVRLSDVKGHLGSAVTVGRALPRVWSRYRELRRHLYRNPVAFEGLGLGLRPYPQDPEGLLSALDSLGVRRILLRLHPWQEEHSEEETLARELHRRGYELSFALPQNRELVKDLGRWQGALDEIYQTFRPFGSHFQIGQAINRSKWGVWNYEEYARLAAAASKALRQDKEVRLLGPAVIDFEYHATAAVLNRRSLDLDLDMVSALLYVDRRGAPEQRQTGFDTIDKIVLLKAIAETARFGNGECWITEYNWPLWEGPHSPAGRDVSVDEDSQANFLVRYCLLVHGTGLIERSYWWQLVARGYGLIAPEADGRLRRRPSFEALATLHRELEGARFLGPEEVASPGHLYRFERSDGSRVLVGWSEGEEISASLPSPAMRVIGRSGEDLPKATGGKVLLDASPRYFILEP